MLVARYKGEEEGGIELREEELPLLENGDALIKVYAVGVCATDGKIIMGKRRINKGLVLGHEIAGKIVELKGYNKDYSIGDMVAIFPGVACKKCYYCKNNYQNICIGKVSFGLQIDGGFQQYMRVPNYIIENGNMLKLPSGINYDEGCFLEPISCCIESIDLVNVKEGDNVLIIGAGVMGLLHLIMLKKKKCNVIISDLKQDRRKLAIELGADIVVDPSGEDLKSIILDKTNSVGVDICFVCADVPLMIENICEMVRKRGAINLFASSIKEQKLCIDPNILHYKEILLTGSHSSSLKQFYDSIKILDNEKDKIDKLITNIMPLEKINEAIDLYLKQEGIKLIIHPQKNS